MVFYDVAFSFAGENRNFVEIIRNALLSKNLKIFYDNSSTSELWGEDLSITLPDHYNSSKLVILFVDKYYLQKMWTIFERQTIISNYIESNGIKNVIVVLLNGFNKKIPGIPKGIDYFNCITKEPNRIIDLLINKITSQG